MNAKPVPLALTLSMQIPVGDPIGSWYNKELTYCCSSTWRWEQGQPPKCLWSIPLTLDIVPHNVCVVVRQVVAGVCSLCMTFLWQTCFCSIEHFNSSASEPCLCLQVDMKPFEESVDDWDVLGCADVPQTQVPENKPQNRLPGLILNQVEKTFNMVQRALNLIEEQQPPISDQPLHTPLTDTEFHKFLDPVGQVVQSRELRKAIYRGGIEPSLRYVSQFGNALPDCMVSHPRR